MLFNTNKGTSPRCETAIADHQISPFKFFTIAEILRINTQLLTHHSTPDNAPGLLGGSGRFQLCEGGTALSPPPPLERLSHEGMVGITHMQQ